MAFFVAISIQESKLTIEQCFNKLIMASPGLNEKIIFGLKLKMLRKENGLLLQDLAQLSGISASYLNEIEKAKKYPRPQKVEILAKCLNTSSQQLLSSTLPPRLTPVVELLESNFLQDLPLDVFGIDLVKIVEMIADAPAKVGAFITTLVEMSRLHGQEAEHFYLGAMRAYQEMSNNYFEDIEIAANNCLNKLKNVNETSLAAFLLEEYGIKTSYSSLQTYPELIMFRSVYIDNKSELLLASALTQKQINYLLAKEIAFHYLKLEQRPETNNLWKIKSFEQVLNNFKAHYFASCLLIPKELFIEDLKDFISRKSFNAQMVESWLEKYQVSPELLMHRFNLLPQFLGIDKLFFVRVIHDINTDQYEIDKELHLSRRHDPQANRLKEHYCRRWLSVSIFDQLKKEEKDICIQAQRSIYLDSENEYICLSISKRDDYNPNKMISITAGLYIEPESESTLKFLNDESIPRAKVNITCERCHLQDCKERAEQPLVLIEKAKRKLINKALEKLLKD